MIVDRALAGKRVVRFQGGDNLRLRPRLRGGPGVPRGRGAGRSPASPVAMPAVAGIPVTHRGVAHEFTVVPGHLPPAIPSRR